MKHAALLLLRQVYALLLALDLLASALTFGAPLQTVSARLAKARRRGSALGRALADAVDAGALRLFGEHNHCSAALEAYLERERAASSWLG
jgi:hypothetical protein